MNLFSQNLDLSLFLSVFASRYAAYLVVWQVVLIRTAILRFNRQSDNVQTEEFLDIRASIRDELTVLLLDIVTDEPYAESFIGAHLVYFCAALRGVPILDASILNRLCPVCRTILF